MRMIEVHEFRCLPHGLLLDVRTPMEYRQMHAPGAKLLPLSDLDAGLVSKLSAGQPVYILCQSGNRAKKAAEKIEQLGTCDVSVIEGGMNAWQAAGLPVERGIGIISLERQVRIAAGAAVLAGVGLGFLLHPGFFLLSGFIGGGLVVGGIINHCGMGLLLARMPWNPQSNCLPSRTTPTTGRSS